MASDSPTATTDSSTADDIRQRALIDRSTKLPVLFFLTSAVSWLLLATILGLIASVKIFEPGFLDWDWLYFLHFGRLQPAFTNAFVYGWAFQVGLGVMIWLMARLCRSPLRNPWTLIVAGHFWNIGLTLGILGIFFGGNTSMEWLEFPPYVWPLMLVAYSIVAVWMIVMFRARRSDHVYISVWYLLGACVWFPWAYLTANVFLHVFEGVPVMSYGIAAWYKSTVTLLFFVPVGLASSYYIVPKITGRPIYNYQLASLGFWALAGLAGWAGYTQLMGGPIPVWMPALSSGAAILLLIPMGAVSLNFHFTTRGQHRLVESSPALRFTFMAGLAFSLWIFLKAIGATFPVSRFTQFTIATEGLDMLVLYGFFSMAMFGAIYYIVPRLVGCEWFSAKIIRNHFWFSVYGVGAITCVLYFGGLAQGASIDAWDRGQVGAVEISKAWLVGRTVAWIFLAYSNLMFLVHLTLMILRLGRRSAQPTLLSHAALDAPESTSPHPPATAIPG
ncbi:cbb3-type cytochrome c oxidase subunit I [soil metagenome]